MKGATLIALSPSFFGLVGCPKVTVDEVMDGLKVADGVAKGLIPIISPVNPQLATVMTRVSADLELIVKTYADYETAAGATPANADLIRATVGSIQANLSAILSAIGVKNPDLINYVSVGVAVINSALVAILAILPAKTTAQAAEIGRPKLPVVKGAKSAKDLKDAWNHSVASGYPQSVLK